MGAGVLNVDCRNLVPPDGITFLRADITDLGDMFADGCAAEIWAKDVLEHFPQAQVGTVLDEWTRLLAPGGILHLKTPDLRALAEFILQGTESDETKAYRVYGGQDYPENFHRAGFTIPLLRTLLEARGLEILEASRHEGTNLLITARRRA
jgi:predicted SAM-dependent methyltransferase